MGKNKPRTQQIIVGVVLIGIGLLWLASNFLGGIDFQWGLLWPVFLLIPGLMFVSKWVFEKDEDDKRKHWGILIPGTILTCLSALFFLNMFVTVCFDYGEIWAWTVFAYPGSVAAAFWVTYFASGKDTRLNVVAKILTVISGVILIVISGSLLFFTVLPPDVIGKLWPLVLIFIGLWMIIWKIFEPCVMKDRSRWFGKSEQEWKEWGQSFGKDMENMGKDIEESVSSAIDGEEAEEDQEE